MIMPGVQKPHWRAWFSWNACCIGCSSPLVGEALDGGDLVTVGLDREHRARLHAATVEVHGAGAAVAGVAADDGAGLADSFAQVLHQQGARLDVVGVRDPVDLDVDSGHRGPLTERRSCATAARRAV